jgi:GNAT superfamily N-acetyltransferase
VIRKMAPGDRALVASSWTHGARGASAWWHGDEYARAASRGVDGLLDRCACWVLANPDDINRILGWTCVGTSGVTPVVHWIWVREDWRRLGLARRLLAHVLTETTARLAVSGWSRMGSDLARGCAEMFKPWPDCFRPDLGRV